MAAESKQKLRFATIVYWILLLYIIAALVWWAISLLQQNSEMYELKRTALLVSSPNYSSDLKIIEDQKRRNVSKYIGEGSAFLLLILIGAGFIYRSVRRQFGLQQQQQNFVMAVTHELKTPLAVSRLNLETLQKYQLEDEKKQRLLQSTLQETLRLDTLINNILISSQLEANAYNMANEELNFSALVTDVIKDFQDRYPYRNIIITIEDEVELKGDTMLLKLLLSNLLENANKYSDKEEKIAVVLTKQQDKIRLEVIDEGEGIPNNEKKAVFQKFYRIGSEQTRKTQGTGLGLYICKKLVAYHRGEITIKDNQPTGSKFIVQFYTA
jgi:K+-sensing histidine kinase KdpD